MNERIYFKSIVSIIFCFLIILLATLTSCSHKDEGILTTTLKTIANVTEFKTSRETDNYCTTPCIFITSEHTYLLRNFPATLPIGTDAINDFIENGTISKTIEIYNNYDYSAIHSEITLNEIQDREVIFYDLSLVSDCFYILGKENIDEIYKTKVYQFDLDGKLLAEFELDITSINNAFLYQSFCYSL